MNRISQLYLFMIFMIICCSYAINIVNNNNQRNIFEDDQKRIFRTGINFY